jgi:hypothetical protein
LVHEAMGFTFVETVITRFGLDKIITL